MFNGNIISVDTLDNHSIFMDLFLNGYYEHFLHTIFSNITIKIPRNRLGQFQNKLRTPYNRNFNNLEEMIIQLYQKGITTREIADIIEKCMVAIIRHKLFLI